MGTHLPALGGTGMPVGMIPDPRQIGDGDGDRDRGFRALRRTLCTGTTRGGGLHSPPGAGGY